MPCVSSGHQQVGSSSSSSGGTGGTGSSSSKLSDGSGRVESWMRLQLVTVRSWVLVLVARRIAPDVPTFQQLAELYRSRVDRVRSLLHATLDACGLDVVHASRNGADVPDIRSPASHTRWERFAFRHLRGRVLPGCSRWGCTNISGLSEAALPTQLCSGCRRARYCSLECQRAAWTEGGHRLVCEEVRGAKGFDGTPA